MSLVQESVADYDVIVIGAGIIGASFALNLAQQSDLKIALVERGSCVTQNKNPNQRVSALGNAAVDVLSNIGVWQTLDDSVKYPYQTMHVWDDNSHGELNFSAKDCGEQQLGFLVDQNECIKQLHLCVANETKLTVYFDFVAQELEFNKQSAQLLSEDGKALTAQLVVAADGVNSWTRNKSNIAVSQFNYQQQGIVCKIKTQDSHQDTAWQIFLDTGPIAILPLKNNESSIVWSADKDKADSLMALNDDEFAQQLANSLGNKLGSVELLSPRHAFDLKSQKSASYLQKSSPQQGKSRVVLIGDAAHSVHPLAGQGANLGFKDVQSLLDVLCNADKDKIADYQTLRKYERKRKPDNEQTDLLMSLLHQAYRQNITEWLAVRGVGMNVIAKSKLLKKRLAQQAMG